MNKRPVEEWSLFEKLRNPNCVAEPERSQLSQFIRFRLEAALHGYIERDDDSSPTHGQMANPWQGGKRKRPAKVITLYLTSKPVMQIEAAQNGKKVRLPDWKFDEETIRTALRQCRSNPASVGTRPERHKKRGGGLEDAD